MSLQAHPAGVVAAPTEEVAAKALGIAALTRGMANGEESAYRRFYEAYFDRLFRYLLVVTAGDEDPAREALQATLVRVVRHIKPFRDEGVFWSWLTVLAGSALSDQTRKHRRYLAFLGRFTHRMQVRQTAQEQGEADARLLESLDRGLQVLPADERELVELKYFTRQSVRDIAAGLQTSEKAVESRLVRIRRKLRQIVLDELGRSS